MKNIKICTVITGQTLREFLDNLNKIQKVSDFIELRVDYIEDLKISDLEIIKNHTIKQSIFTCRSREEGGLFNDSNDKLMQIIHKAIDLKFDHLDIEISKLSLFDNRDFKNVKIIGSYHNFKETPDYQELKNIIKSIYKYSFVDIAKIATFANNEDDVINLTRLLINKKSNRDLIVLGMGEKGKITRVVSPLLGGYLTFASLGKCKSASGQIELSELKNIYED